ncbi:hypothetical protein JNB88_10400 [Rhizobium cauense]|uniref:hypothetical protein n=1 Tax=Rhizobium cauense TaxID=1166683 RepID=UPI001C6DE416|nr:hypothetical protein [Rhizobium cauense]MBW9114048.1 hypothetical protein [Rhizobium cauense]
MRSPWKVIAGFVSRRDPEMYDEAAHEKSVAQDLQAEEPDVQVAEHSRIVSFQSPGSTQRAEDRPAEPLNAQTDDGGQRAELDTVRPVGEIYPNPSLADDIEPVLATTIRLVTKDRLSIRQSLPGSDMPDAEAHDISFEAQSELGAAKTEPDVQLQKAAEARQNGVVVTKPEQTHKRRTRKSIDVAERAIPTSIVRNAPPKKVDGPEVKLVGNAANTDALELDGEITELRYLLAQKLLLQNEQLKQLLARYDGSEQ